MATNPVIADTPASTYALKRIGSDEFRHADPVNGEWWGPLKGAFTFSSVEEAIKYGVYFTEGEAFQVFEVKPATKG